MRTDPPAERLARRVGASPPPGPDVTWVDAADAAASGADADGSVLTRWLPADTGSSPPAWWTTLRADPGRAGVVALGAVALLAVLVTVFVLISDDTPPVASAKLPPVTPPTAGAPSTAAASGPVVVSVAGLVARPGLVTLDAGARIADALAAAGGILARADVSGLNLAQRITDGEQIVVGLAAPPGAPPLLGSSVSGAGAPASGPAAPGTSGRTPSPDGAPAALLDLNTATETELDTLPGVGPVTAAAIVAHREAVGPFPSVDALGDVDGIGPARLAALRDLVAV